MTLSAVCDHAERSDRSRSPRREGGSEEAGEKEQHHRRGQRRRRRGLLLRRGHARIAAFLSKHAQGRAGERAQALGRGFDRTDEASSRRL